MEHAITKASWSSAYIAYTITQQLWVSLRNLQPNQSDHSMGNDILNRLQLTVVLDYYCLWLEDATI